MWQKLGCLTVFGVGAYRIRPLVYAITGLCDTPLPQNGLAV
jgi:hypothetical protein